MDMGAPINAQTGRRRANRLRIRRGVPAQLLTLDGQVAASLLDLSQSGAHIRAKALRRGQDVMLWWLGLETFGKIVWVDGNEAGMEFYDPLPSPILLQTRHQVDAGLAPSTDQQAHAKAREWYLGQR